MILAESFIEAARERGFGLYTGVSCSYLKPFINYCIDAAGLCYIGAANEGGLAFFYGPILPGVSDELPRPDMAPAEVGERFRVWLQRRSAA